MKDESYFKELAARSSEMPLALVERDQAQEAGRLLAALLPRARCADAQVNASLREAISTLAAVYGIVIFGLLPQDSDGRFVGRA